LAAPLISPPQADQDILETMLQDLWGFLKTRKKWWLLPIVVVLVLMAGLLILTESAVIAPFIYALF
jgi:hypothetical protein